MAKTYVLGIGGTGSRILQSLVVLLTAGVECKDEIVPLIIDLDTLNGDTDIAFKMIQSYNNIRVRLFDDNSSTTNNLKFFGTKISTFPEGQNPPNYTIPCIDNPSIKFSEYIGYADSNDDVLLKDNLSTTCNFIDSIFDNSKPDNTETCPTELYLNLKKGFKGRPNIGSVVFDDIKNRPEFKELLRTISQNPSDKIFIISSIFGGTGSSGFPQIIKIIENAPENEQDGGYNLPGISNTPIGALSVFPYFNLKEPEEGSDTSITSDDFMNKAKSALYYYENNMQRIDRMYNLYDDRKRMIKNSSGGNEQDNDAYWIELMGAYAIINFANECNSRESGIDNKFKQATYAYFPNYESGNDFAKLDELYYSNFFQKTQNEILKPLIKLSVFYFVVQKLLPLMGDKKEEIYYKTIIDKNSIQYKFLYNDTNKSNFDTMLKYFDKYISKWFNEIQKNPRGFKLVDFSSDDLLGLVLHKRLSGIDELKNNYIQRLFTNAYNDNKTLPSDLPREVFIMKFIESSVERIFQIIEN